MDRRNILKGAGGVLAASALAPSGARAMDVDSCKRVVKSATFLLVPGAWCGGWVYDDVAEILRSRGHRVFAPSLTGLADRSHLLSKETTLDTIITDVVNLIKWEELSGIVLVGHSHGGFVISSVAQAVPEGTISSIIYLDAIYRRLPSAAPSPEASGGGFAPTQVNGVPCVTAPSAEKFFHLSGEAAERTDRLLTPMPIAFIPRMPPNTDAADRLPAKTFVLAAQSGLTVLRDADRKGMEQDASWTFIEMQNGHMMMLEDPKGTANILEEAA